MSEIKRINPPQMADTSDYGFTQVVVVPSGSELVYIAGQGGADEKGNYGSFTEQMEHAFASLQTALSAVGASPKDVVNSRIPLRLAATRGLTSYGERQPLAVKPRRGASAKRCGSLAKITILSVEHNEEKLKLISAKRKSFWLEHKPASTLIPVPRLASDGMLFEIDAIAMISNY